MGDLCDVCGGVGWDLIASCDKCKASEHLYCMRFPLMEVPKTWFCESCQLGDGEKEYFPNASESNCDATITVSPRKHPDGSVMQHLKQKRIVKTSKVKFIPAEEAIMLSSGAKKGESLTRSSLIKSSSSSTMTSISRTPVGSKIETSKIPRSLVKANPNFSSPEHVKPTRHFSAKQGLQASNAYKEIKTPVAPAKDNLNKTQPIGASKSADGNEASNAKVEEVTNKISCAPSPMHFDSSETNTPIAPAKDNLNRKQPIGASKPADGNLASKTKVKEVTHKISCASSPIHFDSSGGTGPELRTTDVELNELNILSALKNCNPNPPRMDATWRGSFKILTSATLGRPCHGFQAHSPFKVHRKAYEASKQMPEVLQFQLLPRCHLWADIFQDDCPDEDDVALYFIPRDLERSNQYYVCLLEFLEMHDSVLRSYIDGVELLIFTSKRLQLPIDTQSLNMTCFLWGVFRRATENEDVTKELKGLPLLPSPLEYRHGDHNEGNSELIDMEIDMIAGESVGSIDVVIPRKSVILHKFEGKTPTVSGNIGSTVQQPLVKVKREVLEDHEFSAGAMKKIKCEFAYEKSPMSSIVKFSNEKLPMSSIVMFSNEMDKGHVPPPPGFKQKFKAKVEV